VVSPPGPSIPQDEWEEAWFEYGMWCLLLVPSIPQDEREEAWFEGAALGAQHSGP